MSVKEEKIELEGEVTESLRNGMFRIALDNGHTTIGYTAGKMRRYRIRILLGDRVKVELSPYDLNRGKDRVPGSLMIAPVGHLARPEFFVIGFAAWTTPPSPLAGARHRVSRCQAPD